MSYQRPTRPGSLSEVAPPHSGRLTEQRSYRPRNPITEKISRLDWAALADRSQALPTNVSLDHLLEFFGKARLVQLWDRAEPAWDERLTGRGY